MTGAEGAEIEIATSNFVLLAMTGAEEAEIEIATATPRNDRGGGSRDRDCHASLAMTGAGGAHKNLRGSGNRESFSSIIRNKPHKSLHC